jgi:RNA polymerase subunit RPABC4/transcription elongation factor Spt4
MEGFEKDKNEKEVCPYCDDQVLDTKSPFCQPCEVEFVHCRKCGELVAESVESCPYCGVAFDAS